MPTEVGNLSRLAYNGPEAIFGTTNSTPAGIVVRQTGFELNAERSYIDNPELRIDGMVQAGVGGALRGKGSIKSLLSYGTYDDFIAASSGNFGWTSNVAKIRAITVDTAATIAVVTGANTWTRADGGSFITDGFAVGDYINTSGFTNAGNNGSFVISAISALVITTSTATGLVSEGANAAGNISLNTRPSYTLERAHLVNGIYMAFPGCVFDGYELSGKADAAVEGTFNFISKSVSQESNASVFSTITAANSNALLTSWNGSVKKGGSTLANVLGWALKTSRNLDSGIVVGASALYDIQPRAQKITGTMELYFDSYALYTDMRAENDLAIQLNLGPGGTKSYTVDLTRVRIKSWKSVPKDGLMSAMVEWESFVPTSGTNTSMMWTRLP